MKDSLSSGSLEEHLGRSYVPADTPVYVLFGGKEFPVTRATTTVVDGVAVQITLTAAFPTPKLKLVKE